MNTIRPELPNYFTHHYPELKINSECTIGGKISIRFNSIKNELAEIQDRIHQSVERGLIIWHNRNKT